ncbi:PAS domain-containing protein [Allosphingosinicella sp.]|uniref:PAS domain-containing sensor histidine kinase n=1 Tax=Allosphingosinicella sp. TaxID=2823234 RepID=UPI003783FC4C
MADLPASPSEERIAILEAEKARLEADLVRLRESERRYRFSASLAGRLVWVADVDGNMLFLDEPFLVLTGMSPQDGLGAGWLDVIHPDDREPTRQYWLHCVATAEFYAAEFRVLGVAGEYRRTRSRAIAARDEDGVVRCWYGTTEDIEEEARSDDARRAAEEALRESEQLHRNTLVMSQQIAWTAEADGSGLILSDRFQELTGMAGEADDPVESIHPDDPHEVLSRWAEAAATGNRYNARFRMLLRDGSYRYARVRAAPQLDEEGNILRWYGVTEDVHEQEQAQAAQREAEERYRLAAQATNDAIWDCDLLADTIDWGENAAIVLGVEGGPLGRTPGHWWIDRLHPDERATRVQSMDLAIESGVNRWSHTYRFRRDDGSYADIFDRGFIIRDADGRAVRAVGAMQDLTERNRTEAEIRRMQAELIHVSRLSAMGTMASTLAHELNQPLAAITNFLSGTKRIAERPDVPRDILLAALEGAEASSRRAGEILRRLRDLVSRGKVSVQTEHLPDLIEEARALAFDEAAAGVGYHLILDPRAAWVKVDRIQIQQVMINLVRNAVEAMVGSERREVTISTRRAGPMIEIEVADTGPGIPAENMDNLFSEFMTTKSEGMGLGLPISRTIVEAHGGAIRAENRPEGGAAFIFTLQKARTPRV